MALSILLFVSTVLDILTGTGVLGVPSPDHVYLQSKVALMKPIEARCRNTDVISGRVNTVIHWANLKSALCEVPKAASTLLRSGISHELKSRLGNPMVAPPVGVWSSPGVFRYMFVRNPWSRLWSGYVDKLVMPGFRDNKFPIFNALNLGDCRRIPPFAKFLAYLVSHENKPGVLNSHWAPITWVCDPCYFKPHFVGKLETFDRDLEYIGKKLKITDEIRIAYDKEAKARGKFMIPNLLHMYLSNQISCGLSLMGLLNRIWSANILTGRINNKAVFPQAELEKIKPFTVKRSDMIVKIFKKYRLTGEAQRAQKKRLRDYAYAEVPENIKSRIRRMYNDDFTLFGYDT